MGKQWSVNCESENTFWGISLHILLVICSSFLQQLLEQTEKGGQTSCSSCLSCRHSSFSLPLKTKLACLTSFQITAWYFSWPVALTVLLFESVHLLLLFYYISTCLCYLGYVPFWQQPALALDMSNMKLLLGSLSFPLHQSMISVSIAYKRGSQMSTHCSFSHAVFHTWLEVIEVVLQIDGRT